MARKKSTKKISPTVQEYNRERGRIQRQINRMRRRGYMGMEDMLPPKPKKITKASVRRLKKITTKDLYDKADFVDLTTGEVIATGQQGRAIERRQSAQRAAQTRARKRRTQYNPQQEGQEEVGEDREETFSEEVQRAIEHERQKAEEEWQRRREQRDRADRERLERDAELRRQLDEGEMIAQSIEEIINDIEDNFSRTMAKYARQAWEKALKQDRQALYRRLAEHPEVIDALKDSYYQNRSGDHFRPTAFNKFEEILQGEVLSAQQMRDNQDAYERRQALDIDVDEEY